MVAVKREKAVLNTKRLPMLGIVSPTAAYTVSFLFEGIENRSIILVIDFPGVPFPPAREDSTITS